MATWGGGWRSMVAWQAHFLYLLLKTVVTLALGLWPTQGLTRVWKGASQEGNLEVTSHAPESVGENGQSVREWTLTLPSELPLWELESQWTLESSKSNCRGQHPLDWGVPNIIEKLLERKCLKCACMTHLDTFNTSYGQRPIVKLSNWLSTTKSQESPWFPYVRVVCDIMLKPHNKGYNSALDFISIGGLHTKLWAPKVAGVPSLGISRLPLGSHRTKWHLGASPMAKLKAYYKGEGGGFPQV